MSKPVARPPPVPFDPQTIQTKESVQSKKNVNPVVADPDIEYTNRAVKQQKLRDMKAKFIEQMNEKITSARAAYTKVTEQKVKYKFGQDQISNLNAAIKEIQLFSE